MLTFGLLSPGKGIESVIRAMPKIAAAHPEILYIVLGATHPHVRRQAGERYRESLVKLAHDLGVANHIRFEDRFVDQDELGKYLGVADLYVIPYPNAAQITSGTLAYAAGAGKAIVSTPFWHAEELLADGRGQLVPFNDSNATAEAVIHLLSDNNARHAMRRAAYQHTRSMVWPEIGRAYAQLGNDVLAEQHRGESRIIDNALATFSPAIDEPPTLEHLERMTDDTGLLQHAKFAIPDRDHGYCTDDNARALTAALGYYDLFEDNRSLVLADRYLAFLNHAFDRASGRFRNFMSYDRRWLEIIGSEDSHGRAVWSLGRSVLSASTDGTRFCAYRLFKDSLPITETFSSPRSWAFTLLGIDRYLERVSVDAQVQRLMIRLADKLDRFANGFKDRLLESSPWPWPEPELTYDNARIPQALIVAGARLKNSAMLETGVRMLQWLADLQTNSDGQASLVGNCGWATSEGARAIFDQQPLEAAAFVEAAADAYRITGDEVWFDMSKRFYLWFYGLNDLSLPVRDPVTGGCGDGLHAGGVNFNQGAESTLALLSSALVIRNLYRNAVTESDVAIVVA
ncbi:MAG TPA: glycosyltransferase, partial [Tepidisphaeraceae bacterium]|nr:glycosyltransferase [Tepidisphaeraceae bacterium]